MIIHVYIEGFNSNFMLYDFYNVLKYIRHNTNEQTLNINIFEQ